MNPGDHVILISNNKKMVLKVFLLQDFLSLEFLIEY